MLRKWSEPWWPIAIGEARHIAAGGRAVGYVGMAYGAYVDGNGLHDKYQIGKRRVIIPIPIGKVRGYGRPIGGVIMGGIGYWISSPAVRQSVPAGQSMRAATLVP